MCEGEGSGLQCWCVEGGVAVEVEKVVLLELVGVV